MKIRLRHIIFLTILLFLISGYLFIINSLAIYQSQPQYKTIINKSVTGFAEYTVFQDKVSVIVKRPRWYGDIYDYGDYSILYFLNLIELPAEVNGNDWLAYHFLFFLFILIIIILFFTLLRNPKSPEVLVSSEENNDNDTEEKKEREDYNK